tara:strand:+ start:174 stop:509 length:336 start_codon:yes stop_codon:yes gene_type:complete
MAQYKTEFADFDNGAAFDKILNAVAPHGFKDLSWHNDAMPSMSMDCGNGFSLVIRVDYKDPAKSEFPQWRKDKAIKQFMFGELDEDGEHTEEWQYDDIDALITHVEKVMTA